MIRQSIGKRQEASRTIDSSKNGSNVFAAIGNKHSIYAIITHQVFADEEVKLDGVSFCR